MAQAPNAGDMVVLGLNYDNQKITFATLVDIPAATEIKITDKGWNNATSAFTTLSTGDGVVTWTPLTKVDAGSIFTLTLGGLDNTPANNLTNVTKNQDVTSQASFTSFTVTNAMLTNGEQVFIYRGSDSNPYFIFGLNAPANTDLDANNWQTTITAQLIQSMLPNGNGSQNALTNGVNAVGILTDPGNASSIPGDKQFNNVYYTGPATAANRSTWQSRITNRSNWGGDNTGTGVTSVGATLGTSAIALPVLFGKISGHLSGETLIVNWQTISETNNDHFEVQVSTDGNTFVTASSVQSKAINGTSSLPIDYNVLIGTTSGAFALGLGAIFLLSAGFAKNRKRFVGAALAIITIMAISCSKGGKINPASASKVYIRIAQVDKDGSISYSKVILVNH